MLHVAAPLSDDVEKLVHAVIGCCITVHRVLGPGLLEGIYSKAIARERGAAGIAFEREKADPVLYRGESLCEQRLDFVLFVPSWLWHFLKSLPLRLKLVERDVFHRSPRIGD